jgi:acetyl-CoA carboxylase biotin carboxyl carrier protein
MDGPVADGPSMDGPVMDGPAMNLTDADVTDILALLDSLPYDELDLQTPRFRLTLRRTPHGWTQSTQVLSAPAPLQTTTMDHRGRGNDINGPSLSLAAGERLGRGGVIGAREGEGAGEEIAGEPDGATAGGGEPDGATAGGRELVEVRAPLPGTFYRAARPGAAPFVEVGSRVSADTVIGIMETMKLMNSVHAGVAGTVAEFCVQNAEFAAHGTTLLRIRADQ